MQEGREQMQLVGELTDCSPHLHTKYIKDAVECGAH